MLADTARPPMVFLFPTLRRPGAKLSVLDCEMGCSSKRLMKTLPLWAWRVLDWRGAAGEGDPASLQGDGWLFSSPGLPHVQWRSRHLVIASWQCSLLRGLVRMDCDGHSNFLLIIQTCVEPSGRTVKAIGGTCLSTTNCGDLEEAA